MERQDGNEDVIIERLRPTKPFLALKCQDPQLPKQIIGDKKTEHGNHATQHQPMVRIGLSLASLEPSHDKEGGKQRRHQLTEVRSYRRMCSKEPWFP